MNLTKKQKLVYDYIATYIKENGYSPSQTEIQEHFSFKSLGSVQDYIRYLTNAGYLMSEPNAVRGLILTHTDENAPSQRENEIPLTGKVAAGKPIEAIENHNTLVVPPTMLKNGADYFALEVEGLSMIEDGILEGDILVIKKQNEANQGDTVIALIDNEATVKRFYKKRGKVELHPANSTMKPIMVSEQGGDFSIAGIVVGLLRNF